MSTALCTVPAEVVKLASGVQYVDLRTGGGEVRNAWLNGEGTLQIATVTWNIWTSMGLNGDFNGNVTVVSMGL